MMTRTREPHGCGALAVLLTLATAGGAQSICGEQVTADLTKQVNALQAIARVAGRRAGFPAFRPTARIHFVVDPALARSKSYGYTPYAKSEWSRPTPKPIGEWVPRSGGRPVRVSLLDSGIEPLASLVQATDDESIPAFRDVGGAARDFFQLLSENCTRYADLKSFLATEKGKDLTRAIPIFAVAPRFWVEDRGADERPLVCCRLEMRAFWLRLRGGAMREYPDLVACELFYQDSGEGRVEVVAGVNGAVLLSRAMHAALLGRLAASFCLNAAIQSSLAQPTETPKRIGKFRGVSIAEQTKGARR